MLQPGATSGALSQKGKEVKFEKAMSPLQRSNGLPGSIGLRLLGLIAVAVLGASCSSGGQSFEESESKASVPQPSVTQSTRNQSGRNQSTLDPSTLNQSILNPSSGSATSTTVETVRARPYDVGNCVIYDDANKSLGGGNYLSADITPTRVVSCDQPHFYEITGTFQLRGHSEYPTPDQWNEIFRKSDDGCRSYAERFLNAPLDPSGRFVSTGLKPSPTYWAKGNRDVVCALGAVKDPLDVSDGPPRSQGSALGQSQTRLRPVGSCFATDPGSQMSSAVTCDKPHGLEVTGSINIADRASEPPSTDEEWGRLVATDCRRLAERYLGRPIDNRTVRASYFSISPESWLAGRREVDCLVGRYDAAGVKIAIEGLLRDQP
jgi:hypothetical protein